MQQVRDLDPHPHLQEEARVVEAGMTLQFDDNRFRSCSMQLKKPKVRGVEEQVLREKRKGALQAMFLFKGEYRGRYSIERRHQHYDQRLGRRSSSIIISI